MTQPEQRRTARLLLRIPIRVMGFETARGEFSEDTCTVTVNRAGALIALSRLVAVSDTLRIVNLENHHEADFRVVAPTSWTGSEINGWGVECLEPDRNIWGIEFAPPLSGEAGTLVECRDCHRRAFWALTPMEVEVLDTAGVVQRHCNQCGKPTFWMHADVNRRPVEFPPLEAIPSPPPVKTEKEAEKRKSKRLGMRLPILVRGPFGQEEVSKTEDVSKSGLAVSLAMGLAMGDVVRVVYPYSPGGQNIEQEAEVRRRATYAFGGRRLYGLRLTP